MKYIDWLIQWLENFVRPSVKVRTYERYKLIIEQHIKDKIGGLNLNDLSPLVLSCSRQAHALSSHFFSLTAFYTPLKFFKDNLMPVCFVSEPFL